MLLRFAISNHLSIRSRAEVSFVGTTLKDERGTLLEAEGWPHGGVSPGALVYGANASGKSNLVSAIHWMRQAVLFSHIEDRPGVAARRRPFLLDRTSKSEPTCCEADFLLAGRRCCYRFSATDEAFVAEDLYVYDSRRLMGSRRKGGPHSLERRHSFRRQKTLSRCTAKAPTRSPPISPPCAPSIPAR